MNWRLIAMVLGTLACAAPLVVAPDLLSRNVIQAASFGELACTVDIEPSTPVFIACNMSSASSPRLVVAAVAALPAAM